MLELYFLIYRIPRMMTRLARERNRSALKWSLFAVFAWLGAEFLVMFMAGAGYATASLVFGWSAEMPAGFTFLMYIVALAAAIGAAALVRKILISKSAENDQPLPPPPPAFSVTDHS